MNHIEALLRRLAPDGVESRSLGEIGQLVRGHSMPKTDFVESGIGAIHYGQIYTYYDTWTATTLSHVAPTTATRLAKVDPGDVIITNTSENLDDVGKAVAWLGDHQIVTGGHATVLKHQEDPKFIAYWFQTPHFYDQKKPLATGTKVIDVSASNLAKVRIPLPPLEIQRGIVEVLDTFRSLEAELEAELEARRRQYVHYRRMVLDRVSAESVQLSELGRWQGGVTPSKANPAFWEGGKIPWLASMDVSSSGASEIRGSVTEHALRETGLRLLPEKSVIAVMRSNILRRTLPFGLTSVQTTVNQDVRGLVPREGVDPDYVYQALLADSERIRMECVRTDGSMAAVDSQAFFSWRIPLPSMAEQKKVADALSHFDALVNDLSIGLPAELAARRKQYEYYRDRLLTFEEAA